MLKSVSSITNAIGALNYKGIWDATANSPALTSGAGTKGDYYVVGTAGATTLDGISNWGVGDWVVFNGTAWQRVEGGADLNGVNLSVSGTSTLSNLTASTALALNASKAVVSVTNTGTGNNVLATAPTLSTGVTFNTSDSYIKWEGNNLDLTSTTASVPIMNLRGQGTLAGIMRIWNADNTTLVTAIAGLANSDSFINNGGNFGVGTASPFSFNGRNLEISAADYARLHLVATGGSGRRYWFNSNDDGTFALVDGTASAGRVNVDASGNTTLSNSTQYFGMSQYTKKKWIQFAYPGAGKFGAGGDCTDFFVAGSDNDLTRARLTAGGNWGLIGTSFNGQTLNDYAEYFEWADGNPDAEDRVGLPVVLDDNKVRIATAQDPASSIIGAVSANAGTVHGAATLEWANKYQKDDYGRTQTVPVRRVSWTEKITHTRLPRFEGDTEASHVEEKHHNYDEVDLPSDVVVPEDAFWRTHNVPVENPNYDPAHEYISRTERPEWACIGIMGQVRIRRGSPVGDRWIKMRDISEAVEEWLVR
jgi:hypothetical protein